MAVEMWCCVGVRWWCEVASMVLVLLLLLIRWVGEMGMMGKRDMS
jgi:hypothetical protein